MSLKEECENLLNELSALKTQGNFAEYSTRKPAALAKIQELREVDPVGFREIQAKYLKVEHS